MIDLDEIYKRAQKAQQQASARMDDMFARSEELAKKAEQQEQEREKAQAAEPTEPPTRQVEILGQPVGPEGLPQMASKEQEEQLRAMVQQEVAGYAALGVDGMMEKLLGEDMGVLSAALETLAMEDDDEDDEEPLLDEAREQALYQLLEEKLARIQSLPEPQPVLYAKDDPRWERFGILLSGMISHLNGHELDGMDVEEHIPVMEQRIVSLVRRSWGIDGRGELLDTLRYLTQEGYALRYQLYCEAQTPQALWEEDADEEERASAARGWRFAQRFKAEFSAEFLLGWDLGRAAMLTRWGCYLGWLTEGEALGVLWDVSHRAAQSLHSWREFAQSYLFGGLLWKLLQGAGDAESYLGFLEDAATALLTGDVEQEEGQWKTCPWPQARKLGFQAPGE